MPAASQVVADWELEEDNPVENKYRKLAHKLLRGLVDPELRPNKKEREALDRVINSHSLDDHLRMEEKDLLWKFRHCLTDDRKALTKLLLSVDWGVEAEVAQMGELLAQWRERAPIDVSDALKLLGRERAFQTQMVRSFAVDTLRQASDDELMTYMLQLVQALRYEPGATKAPGALSGDVMEAGDHGPSSGGAAVDAATASVAAAAGAQRIGLAPAGPAAGTAEAAAAAAVEDGVAPWERWVSPLAQFLIARGSASLELANFLYWYLKVGLEDATHGAMYRCVLDAFRSALLRTNCIGFGGGECGRGAAGLDMWSLLQAQEQYFSGIAQAQRMARDEKGRKAQKEDRLQKLLEVREGSVS
ncbi:unnamed protein product [Phaeothamnion confervicola]